MQQQNNIQHHHNKTEPNTTTTTKMTTTNMTRLNVKLQVGQSGTFHRFALDGGEALSFEALQARLRAIGPLFPHRPDAAEPLITYQDDEDDTVAMASDTDLQMAAGFLSTGSPLRLTVRQRAGAWRGQAPGVRNRGPGCHIGRHHRHGQHGHGSGGGWHRWAVQQYGPAPARRLAAAAGLESHQVAVGKLVEAMHGNADAVAFVDAAMKKSAGCPGHHRHHHHHNNHRCGGGMRLARALGVHRHEAWVLMKAAGQGDEAAKATIAAAMGGIKAAFGQKAATALGISEDEAWELLRQAQTGDAAARARVGAAMKTAWAKHGCGGGQAADSMQTDDEGGHQATADQQETAPLLAAAAAAAAASKPRWVYHKKCPLNGCNSPLKPAAMGHHVCDECGQVGTSHRCSGGCDFDLCTRCAAKPAAAPNVGH